MHSIVLKDQINSEYKPHQAKMYFRVMCGQRRPRLDCTDTQPAQGLCPSQTESLDTTECFNEEQYLDATAHVQDDVNPHINRMFEGTFSLDAAHITTVLKYGETIYDHHICTEHFCSPSPHLSLFLSIDSRQTLTFPFLLQMCISHTQHFR